RAGARARERRRCWLWRRGGPALVHRARRRRDVPAQAAEKDPRDRGLSTERRIGAASVNSELAAPRAPPFFIAELDARPRVPRSESRVIFRSSKPPTAHRVAATRCSPRAHVFLQPAETLRGRSVRLARLHR